MTILNSNGTPISNSLEERVALLEKNLMLVAKHNDQRTSVLTEGFSQTAIQNQLIMEYVVNELNRIANVFYEVLKDQGVNQEDCMFRVEEMQSFFERRYKEIREEVLQAKKSAELAKKLAKKED